MQDVPEMNLIEGIEMSTLLRKNEIFVFDLSLAENIHDPLA
jgi:hypothetical protein